MTGSPAGGSESAEIGQGDGDVVDLREDGLLQRRLVRHMGVQRATRRTGASSWKGVLGRPRRHLAAEARRQHVLVDHEEAVVRATEAATMSWSHGTIVRRSTTSAS